MKNDGDTYAFNDAKVQEALKGLFESLIHNVRNGDIESVKALSASIGHECPFPLIGFHARSVLNAAMGIGERMRKLCSLG